MLRICSTVYVWSIFRKKDKNLLDGKLISDWLVYYVLELMGSSRNQVDAFFINEKTILANEEENFSAHYLLLKNNCLLHWAIENDEVFRLGIYLNSKPSESDMQNLIVFELTHTEDYRGTTFFDETLGRHFIFFESNLSD